MNLDAQQEMVGQKLSSVPTRWYYRTLTSRRERGDHTICIRLQKEMVK